MLKIFLKTTFNGGVNQPTFLHYCLLQGVKGVVKKYRGGGPEHFEMWWLENT